MSEEHYFDATHELVPASVTRGTRVYVMLHPYVLQPKLIMTVGLYKKPKQYADADSAIGKTLGTHQEGMQRLRVGEAFVRLPDDTVRRVTTPTLPTVPVSSGRLSAVREYYLQRYFRPVPGPHRPAHEPAATSPLAPSAAPLATVKPEPIRRHYPDEQAGPSPAPPSAVAESGTVFALGRDRGG